MCELSEKLKLCTCAGGDIQKLDNYWVFFRKNPTKDQKIVGKVRMPDKIGKEVEAHNRALLLARLHEPDAFDVDLRPSEGDRLALTFTCSEPGSFGKAASKTITYGYSYENGRWREERYDSLGWLWHHDHEGRGEVRLAFGEKNEGESR